MARDLIEVGQGLSWARCPGPAHHVDPGMDRRGSYRRQPDAIVISEDCHLRWRGAKLQAVAILPIGEGGRLQHHWRGAAIKCPHRRPWRATSNTLSTPKSAVFGPDTAMGGGIGSLVEPTMSHLKTVESADPAPRGSEACARGLQLYTAQFSCRSLRTPPFRLRISPRRAHARAAHG
jgi:hypothetical protein